MGKQGLSFAMFKLSEVHRRDNTAQAEEQKNISTSEDFPLCLLVRTLRRENYLSA